MNRTLQWGLGAAGVVLAIVVYLASSSWIAASVVAFSAIGGSGSWCFFSREKSSAKPQSVGDTEKTKAPAKVDPIAAPEDSEDLAQQMLKLGRYSLLLRPQIAESIPDEILQQAQELLDDDMTLVPEGDCIVGKSSDGNADLPEHMDGRMAHVEGFYVDRFQVTNDDYYKFVQAGGYEQLSLWDQEIVPALLDFVDETGVSAPKYWRDGCFLPGQEKHPVVGVCWYEAAAYARWVGKRLPTDPEWVKAGSWPVPLPGSRPVQRKYPWGDVFDQEKTHLWGSGSESTVAVDSYEDGMSVGGAYQLIGNVWEWTSSRFGAWQTGESPMILDAAMRSVRGGAFDTYFEQQATCDYQSGDKAIARKRNVGFRCAIGICDLVPDSQLESPAEELPSQVAEVNV